MTTPSEPTIPAPVWVAGLPLTPITFAQTLDLVDRLIATRRPHYFITANLHYAMLTSRDPRLEVVNRGAAFIVADGMPLVWAARRLPVRLPERVAGSDLMPALCGRAAEKGHRVYILGGAAEVAEKAAANLRARFPALQIVGVDSPPFRPLSPEETARMLSSIRAAQPDLLFVAFSQPKGEFWMAEYCPALGVPVSVQVGATVDFVAGAVNRAPRWFQRTGLEWLYRIYTEPRRLGPRYLQDIRFLIGLVTRTLLRRTGRGKTRATNV